jgi:hypothetical protein
MSIEFQVKIKKEFKKQGVPEHFFREIFRLLVSFAFSDKFLAVVS